MGRNWKIYWGTQDEIKFLESIKVGKSSLGTKKGRSRAEIKRFLTRYTSLVAKREWGDIERWLVENGYLPKPLEREVANVP